ncbi:MAG: YkgJ family cysteine cluster protein [Thermodesulfobacteriota bacterium]
MPKTVSDLGRMQDVQAVFPDASAWEEVRLVRNSPFSYDCQGCCRCCQHKRIRVNPYEVARLANGLGISTTDFLGRYSRNSGTELQVDGEDRCVFLTGKGCGVHPDRPLVCRLYPLARHTDNQTGEYFSLLPPHPQTQGLIGQKATVRDYLSGQGAEPFITVTDRYLSFVGKLAAFLLESEKKEWREKLRTADPVSDMLPVSELLDMDLALTRFALPAHPVEAMSLEDKTEAHLRLLEEQIQAIVVGDARTTKHPSGGRHGKKRKG